MNGGNFVKQSRWLMKIIQEESIFRRNYSDVENMGKVLKQNENVIEYKEGLFPVSKVFSNQIGSHIPIQDTWGEAIVLHNKDIMYGVFDGNNGIACSHVVAKRIFQYIAVSLLPQDLLSKFVKSSENPWYSIPITKSFLDKHFFQEDYWKTYNESLNSYARDLLKRGKELNVKEALEKSFQRLDSDLSREALEDNSQDKRLLWVAMTGATATILHISGRKLTTATAGDSMVVVGTSAGVAKVLTPEHNVENREELERVQREHPGEKEVVENGLLLGSLTSFRSFGNCRYKWSRKVLEEKVAPVYGKEVVPAKSVSPPYLTARPDIGEYTLQPGDSFIVIASDGIWDIFPPKKVVEIVANHRPVHWAKRALLTPWTTFQKTKKILRNEPLKDEPEVLSSPATQLIHEALLSTSRKLKLPRRYSRRIRDDMTVLVLYIDWEGLKRRADVKEELHTALSKKWKQCASLAISLLLFSAVINLFN